MGLIYEHWRPDLNCCFYVGASKVGVDRAANFSSRNDAYEKVCQVLKEKGYSPEFKMIWENVPDDCLGTYEKIRILYQKSLLGEGLTNIARGGFGIDLEWTEELREKHRKACLRAGSRTIVKQRRTNAQLEAQNRPEVNQKRSKSLIAANLSLDVKERRSQAAKLAHQWPDVKNKHRLAEANPIVRALRIEAAKKGGEQAAKRSPEERRASALKAVETRRLNKEKKTWPMKF